MKSRWSDADASECIARWGPEWGEDLALRTYTSRLIGSEPTLVLHGGGNTSVKTTVRDRVHGTPIEVLCVKGSGWDLGTIEPPGLPAVRLEPLRALRSVERLSDEEMVNQVRTRLLDANAPTPSVETLLHAFLPHKFVDHTHADAILVLTNQPDGEAVVREALGSDIAVLPWIMPGHPLAEAVADAFERQPTCSGIVLLGHGIFTFGDDARTSYERMIALCSAAERYAQERVPDGPAALRVSHAVDAPEAVRRRALAVLPVLRGACAVPGGEHPRRFVAELRSAPDLVAFSRHPSCRALCAAGPLTPDHVIRTKAGYLVLEEADARDPERARAAVERWADGYRAWFEANRSRAGHAVRMLDPHPRVAVVEGLGVCAFGGDTRAARIAADIAEHTLRAKALADALGGWVGLPEGDLFDMEYWSLEQAKLGRGTRPLLDGRVALVTGAAGAIGHGVAEELLAAGAHVCVTDRDAERLAAIAGRLRDRHGAARVLEVVMDVTDPQSVAEGFAACVLRFGGLDVLVPNAGIAHVATLRDMDPEAFARVVDVNLTGTMLVLRQAVPIFAAQRTGGAVVVQASKNVFAPGAGFGAYSASKAGALQLMRVAALELAPLGVRVNAINADAVFGDVVPSGLWEQVGAERMRARGLDPEQQRDFYRERSLLKVPVTPAHVGRAVVFLASGATPTTGAVLPVDAGVPAAFPR